MDDQAGRLVDHEDVRVLEYHSQRNLFRGMLGGRGQGLGRNDDRLAAPHLGFSRCRASVKGNESAAHPVLQAVARILREQAGQGLIEPQSGAINGNVETTNPV